MKSSSRGARIPPVERLLRKEQGALVGIESKSRQKVESD